MTKQQPQDDAAMSPEMRQALDALKGFSVAPLLEAVMRQQLERQKMPRFLLGEILDQMEAKRQ